MFFFNFGSEGWGPCSPATPPPPPTHTHTQRVRQCCKSIFVLRKEVFWVTATSGWAIAASRSFENYLHLQGYDSHKPEDKGSTFRWNVIHRLPNHTTQHLVRPASSHVTQLKPHITVLMLIRICFFMIVFSYSLCCFGSILIFYERMKRQKCSQYLDVNLHEYIKILLLKIIKLYDLIIEKCTSVCRNRSFTSNYQNICRKNSRFDFCLL
jgi:hypothetical protein